MRNRGYKIICFAIAAGAMSIANADSMRCGKWVVSESVTVDELVNKCGQPKSRDVTKDDVYITNANGMRVKTGNFTVTERWLYQPSPSSLPMAVVIVDGRIVSLTRVDR
ncbi:MAG TPA: DUF2845 domain-containing protein [Steroidobacter sp.]|uniref:DUF2845 domain-containing protein n=1 Tax=Steroidobacter sp. TaxID=1978227 RepID=UPI002ED9B992